ncbi:MAG: YdcF family protein [Candidatus Schekmanbacteria bacterium]|nr:YdcF family protein [Candidatus Schekmanbacteria bacterium]
MSGEDPIEKADAMVILGGGSGGEREEKACEIYSAGYVKGKVILTGGNREDFISDRQAFMKNCGVPARDISVWQQDKNTYEEMLSVKNFIQSEKIKKVIVVSDAPHMPRLRYLKKVLELEENVILQESTLVYYPTVFRTTVMLSFWYREPLAYLYYRIRY